MEILNDYMVLSGAQENVVALLSVLIAMFAAVLIFFCSVLFCDRHNY